MAGEHMGAVLEYGVSLIESGFARSAPMPTEAIQIETHSGSVKKTSVCRLRVLPDHLALIVVRTGTVLAWNDSAHEWIVLPPNSLAYATGPVNIVLHLAKGEQRLDVLSFGSAVAPYLATWMDRTAHHRQIRLPLVTMAISPIFRSSMARIDRAMARADRTSEPIILGALHEILPRLSLSESDIDLAPLPTDLPANIKQLTDEVKQRPDQPWPLKDAADYVGYSPFHFSRVFKQLVGYGFHEFVDRCRTENAVRMICGSETPIDVLAAGAGFGTTQALRESIKEYLGLVPSELRAEPETLLKS
ncbi:MAG: AraC family transcriptional regulator [Fimbriimonadales bacterium]